MLPPEVLPTALGELGQSLPNATISRSLPFAYSWHREFGRKEKVLSSWRSTVRVMDFLIGRKAQCEPPGPGDVPGPWSSWCFCRFCFCVGFGFLWLNGGNAELGNDKLLPGNAPKAL